MKREDFKEIVELPIHFNGRGSTRGYKFDQIYNTNGWYIYAVTIPKSTKPHYEVFKEKIQQHRVYDNGWRKVDNVGKVVYPFDEAFGHWARSCPTIESCMKYIYKNGRL